MSEFGQDYVLRVGLQLNEASITQLEREVAARLAKAFSGLKIIDQSSAATAIATLGNVTKGGEEAAASISNLNKSFAVTSAGIRELGESWKANTVNLAKQAAEETAIIEKMVAEQAAIIKAGNESIAASHSRIMNSFTSNTAMLAPLDSMGRAMDAIKSKMTATREGAIAVRNAINQIGGPRAFGSAAGLSSSEMDKVLGDLREQNILVSEQAGFWEHNISAFGRHIAQWTMMSIAIGVAYTALDQFNQGLQRAAEFQREGVLAQSYQRAGRDSGISSIAYSTQQLFERSIPLASAYGDNVNDVAQDIALWAKTTGDLNSALYMTNEALKFQMTTGTSLEDVYKTLTALANQAQNIKMSPDDRSLFNLSRTHDVLNEIYAAAATAGAGMRQLSSSGFETTTNSANILLEAMERDTAALGKMGLSIKEIIALNQSLITASGNSGAAADGAAEKLSRLVGGIMALSQSGKANALSKEMGDNFAKLQEVMNTSSQGNFLERFAEMYQQLDNRSKNVLDTTIASQRQYELNANMVQQILTRYQGILKAEGDKGILDATALQMTDTLSQKTATLASEWNAVVQVIATGLIPLLSRAAGIAARILPGLMMTGANDSEVSSALGGNKDYQSLRKAFAGQGGYSDTDAFIALVKQRAEAGHFAGHLPNLSDGSSDLSYGNVSGKNSTSMQNIVRLLASTRDGRGRSMLQDLGLSSLEGTTGGAAGDLDAINHMGIDKYIQTYVMTNDIRARLAGAVGKAPDTESSPYVVSGAGGAGAAKDYAQFGAATQSRAADLQAQADAYRGAADQANAYVDAIKLQIQYGGNNVQLTQELTKHYNEEADALKREREAIGDQIGYFKQRESHADTMAKHSKGSERDGWMGQSTDAKKRVNDLTLQYIQLAGALMKVTQDAKDANAALAESQEKGIYENDKGLWGVLQGQYSSGKAGLGNIGSLQARVQADYNQAQTKLGPSSSMLRDLKTLLDDIGKAADEDRKKISDWSDDHFRTIQDQATSTEANIGSTNASPLYKIAQEYDKQIAAIQKSYNEFLQQYKTETEQAAGDPSMVSMLNGVKQLEDAWVQNAMAVAQYNAAIQAVEQSPTYQAFVGVATLMGNGLNSLITNTFNSANNMQLNALASGIGTTQFEQTMLGMSPFAKYDKLQALQNQQQIHADQLQEQYYKNKEEHPTFGTQIWQQISKTFADSFTKDLEDNLESSFKSILIPDSTTSALQQSQQQFATATTQFGQFTQQFANAVQSISGSGAGGPLGSNSFSGSSLFPPSMAGSLDTSGGAFGMLFGSSGSSALANSIASTAGSSATGGTASSTTRGSGTNAAAGLIMLGGGGASLSAITSAMLGSSASSLSGGGSGVSGGGGGGGGSVASAPSSSSSASQLSTGGGSTGTISISGGSGSSSLANMIAGGGGLSGAIGAITGGGGSATTPGSISIGGPTDIGASGAAIPGGSGGASSGSVAGAGGSLLGKWAGGLASMYAGASMVGAGYSAGGVGGALESGIGAYSAVSAAGSLGLASMLGMSAGAFLTAVALPIAVIAGALSLFHPHYSPSTNPDMYADDGFAQGVADAQGQAYTQANGWVYEDSSLKQQLGGMTELQYLTSWYNQYPGGQNLDSSALTLWNEIGQLTGNGQGVGVGNLHQGNVSITNASGQTVGMSANWQTLLNDVDTYTQDLYTLLSTGASDSTPIISVNAYGGSGVNSGLSAWYTPGMSSSQIGAILNAPYGATATANGVQSGLGISGSPLSGNGGQPSANGNTSVSLSNNQNFTTQVNVDGQTLAQVVNAYNYQRAVQGFSQYT